MIDRRLETLTETLLRRHAGGGAALVHLDLEPLRGGLSADQVFAATAEYLDPAGRRRSLEMVVKRLSGAACREAAIYRGLERGRVALAPRVLAIHRHERATTLFLERIPSVERWPWRRLRHGEAVLRAAATLHLAALECRSGWEYDRELLAVAGATADAAAAARRSRGLPIDAASLRAVRRVAGAVGRIRRDVLACAPFASTLIHGDLHPGNVMLSNRAGALAPVLLDWGRARMGSPLEDVASWVQSLGCWEPEARLRHDSLLAAYLRARGCEAGITTPIRHAYWLAGACNALAGALLHHLQIATSRSAPRATRAESAWAVRDWLRIIRRAGAVWLESERAPRGERARRTRPPVGSGGSSRAPTSTRSSVDTSSTSRS